MFRADTSPVHWFGLVFGMGVLAFATTVGIQASVSYCVDTYKDLSGEALVTVIIIRNTMSFAIGYGYVISLPVSIFETTEKPF